VTPTSGSGKAIIDRCMTDESILKTELIDEIPDDHRPDDEWIAARLRVDNEFKKRLAAGVQRKFKRNFQGGMGTGYTTSDEVWSHFKPTPEQLEKWIHEEDRGEKRIDEQTAMKGDGDTTDNSADDSVSDSKDDVTTLLSDAEEEQQGDDIGAKTASKKDQEAASRSTEEKEHEGTEVSNPTTEPTATAEKTSSDAPPKTWLGMLPALRDGPQQQ
jgi:platelet-activating factor acetylhydrolase